jgi:hypothetical protein
MNTVDKKYMGIFHNVTPGRLDFCLADINSKFMLTKKQTISFQWHENIPDHLNTYGAYIRNILYYSGTYFYFISYLYDHTETGYLKTAIDIVVKNSTGVYQYYSLKDYLNKNIDLVFAKVVNNILFFSFSDNSEILYAMELGSSKYVIKQYNHQAGLIQNIWLKTWGNFEYIFTSKKGKEIVSGVLKITEQQTIDIIEIYDFKVAGYNTCSGFYVYYNQNNILTYQNINNLNSYVIKEFISKEEEISDIFFLEDDSFIIVSTTSVQDYFANIFFGSGNLKYYFYYYHVKKHEQDNNFIIKKLKNIKAFWRLEQLIF